MIVAVDVDEVCAQMLAEWLHRYNETYHDDLSPDEVTAWEVQHFVKPECGHSIFGFLRDPSLYDAVKPYPGAREAIMHLKMAGHRVIFATSCVEGSFDAKLRWLRRHDFLGHSRGALRDFFPVADKSMLRADVLVDDHVGNLKDFPGLRILVDRPHNAGASITEYDARVSGLLDAAGCIAGYASRAIPLPVGRREAHVSV